MKDAVEELLPMNGDHFETHLDAIYSKLVTYEHEYPRLPSGTQKLMNWMLILLN